MTEGEIWHRCMWCHEPNPDHMATYCPDRPGQVPQQAPVYTGHMNDYQGRAALTALYPDSGTGSVFALSYVALGLAGEAGEISNKVKKLLRDGDTPELREAIAAELGDVLWYLARAAEEIGLPLGVVADRNLTKLASRAERGAITGSGDQR